MSDINLKIGEEKARQIYLKADDNMKQILEASAPKGFFSMKITDRVKTFEDACRVTGVSSAMPFPNPSNEIEEDTNASHVVTIIHSALCEGWKADWGNHNQKKYYPYFYSPGSGLGLAYYFYLYAGYFTGVGSRRVYPTSELAIYAGKQFEKEYVKHYSF